MNQLQFCSAVRSSITKYWTSSAMAAWAQSGRLGTKRLNRLIAIKVLLPDKIADVGRKQRFVQEAQAASALNHPNIVVIHDVTSVDGVEIIVMECVAWVTLDRYTGFPRQFEALDVERNSARESPRRHGEVVPDLSRDPEKIIVGCLRKDPSRRFQDAADLKVALAELKEESDSGALHRLLRRSAEALSE